MRTVPAGLTTHIAGEELTLAQCVKVTRRDAEVFAFSTCNEDLVVDGVTYLAVNSVSATAQNDSIGSGVDNLQFIGLLCAETVTEEDLLSGRFDGAEIEIFLVNWLNIAAGQIVLFAGWIGNVQLEDGQFVAEVRSKSQRLSQHVGQLTSALCRVSKLGDARCKKVLTSFRFSRTVYSVTSNREMTFDADAAVTGYYDCGLVTFTTGLNIGISKEVKLHTLTTGRAVIELQESFPLDVAVGDVATLEAGCDRRLITCYTKFNNVVNYRGEPHVPGTDKMLERGRE